MQSTMLKAIVEDFGNGGTIDGDLVVTGDLQVSGGGSLSFDEIVSGTQVVEITNTEALLVRKASDGGDVFIVDTTNSRVGVGLSPSYALDIKTPTGDAEALAITGSNNTTAFTHGVTGDNYYLKDKRANATRMLLEYNGNVTFYNNFKIDGNLGIGDSPHASRKLAITGTNTTNATAAFYTNAVHTGTADDAVFSVRSDNASASGTVLNIHNDGSGACLNINSNGSGKALIADADVEIISSSASNTKLLIENNNASANAVLQIDSSDDRDSVIQLLENGTTKWDIRNDGNDSDKLKISDDGDVRLTISQSGSTTIFGNQFIEGTDAFLQFHDTGETTHSGSGVHTIISADDKLKFMGRNDAASAHVDGFSLFRTGVVQFHQNVGVGVTPTQPLDVTGNAKISGNVAIGASVGSFKLEVQGGDVGLFKSVSSGSGINNILTIGATDGGVNMAGGEGAGIVFKIPDDETNPSIGAQIGAIRESADDSISSTALVFSTSQNDETLDEAMRIDSSGNVSVGTTATYGNLTVGGTGELIAGRASSGAGSFSMYEAGTGRFVIESLNGSGGLAIKVPTTEAMRIDSSGNIGIGISDPDAYLAGARNLVLGGTSGDHGLTIRSASDSKGIIAFGDGDASSDAGYRGQIQYLHSSDKMLFITSTANRMILDANSRISLGNNDSSGATTNTIFGRLAGNAIASGAIDNVLIGNEAGNSVTTGDYLVAIGSHALHAEDVGRSSIAIGAAALGSQNTVSEGSANTIGIGTNAGHYNVTGTENVHIGHNSGLGTDGQSGSNITAVGNEALKVAYGQDNVAIGRQAGLAVTSGVRNLLIGTNAGDAITDANYVTAVGIFAGSAINHTDADGTTLLGYSAGLNITSGSENTAIGYEALKTTGTGSNNTAVGYQALTVAPDGADHNTAIGRKALTSLNHGSADGNTAVGTSSGLDLTTGYFNTSIGFSSGSNLTTGNNCTSLGYNADYSGTGAVNETVIGSSATGQGDNSVTLGNSSVTNVYMAQDSGATVHCAGVNFPDSQVASADANTLDDYEEGTFTPTLTTNATDFTSVTYDSATSGRYTKVGNLVHVQGFIKTDAINIGSASGDVSIGGLPFTAITSSTPTQKNHATINISLANGWAGENPSHGLLIGGGTIIQLYYADYNVDANSIAVSDVTGGTVADKNQLYFAGTYLV